MLCPCQGLAVDPVGTVDPIPGLRGLTTWGVEVGQQSGRPVQFSEQVPLRATGARRAPPTQPTTCGGAGKVASRLCKCRRWTGSKVQARAGSRRSRVSIAPRLREGPGMIGEAKPVGRLGWGR